MKAEEGRREGGINRKQLAYATPMRRTSEAIKTRGNRTADRRQLGVKYASWVSAKIGEQFRP
jgi:hypothetical protein